MNYLSVAEIAKLWNLSERSIRNYCSEGRIPGAMLIGKTWMIPSNAVKPDRKERISNSKKTLLDILKLEKGYLIDTCLAAQDQFKIYLDYFRIDYDK